MESLSIAIAAIVGISIALVPVLIGLSVEHHDRRSVTKRAPRERAVAEGPRVAKHDLNRV
jgi:hypothetical protein